MKCRDLACGSGTVVAHHGFCNIRSTVASIGSSSVIKIPCPPMVARTHAKEAAGEVALSRRTGEAHPILEQKNIRDEMIRAEAKCPGDAQFSSRIDEYLAARTANGNGLRDKRCTHAGGTRTAEPTRQRKRRLARCQIKRQRTPRPTFGRCRALPTQGRRRLPARKRSCNKSATDRGEHRQATGAGV